MGAHSSDPGIHSTDTVTTSANWSNLRTGLSLFKHHSWAVVVNEHAFWRSKSILAISYPLHFMSMRLHECLQESHGRFFLCEDTSRHSSLVHWVLVILSYCVKKCRFDCKVLLMFRKILMACDGNVCLRCDRSIKLNCTLIDCELGQ